MAVKSNKMFIFDNFASKLPQTWLVSLAARFISKLNNITLTLLIDEFKLTQFIDLALMCQCQLPPFVRALNLF